MSLYKLVKLFEMKVQNNSQVDLVDTSILLKIYSIHLNILDGLRLSGESVFAKSKDSTTINFKEICRFLINITEFLFELDGPTLNVSLTSTYMI